MSVHPDQATFLELAKTADVVPVWLDLMADLETPVSAYAKLKDAGPSYLLESDIVYADNIQALLIDSGYWTEEEVASGQAG